MAQRQAPDPYLEAFLQQAVHHLSQDFLPKIRKCVELLSEEELWWRPNPHCNSVGNLLLHLSGNVRQWILSGVGGQEDRRQRDREFSETGPLPAASLLQQLEDTVREAVTLLQEMEPESLLKIRRIQVYEVNGLQAIFHVVEHFSHHTGQIIYITKQLKNQDLKFYNL